MISRTNSISPISSPRIEYYNDEDSNKISDFCINKKIFTPKWNFSKKLLKNNIINVQNKYLKDIHYNLEIIECRIIDGILKDVTHPCLSIKIDQNDLKLNKKENLKIKNYNNIIEKKEIPNFWEKRIWDNKNNILNEDDSNELKEKINFFSDSLTKNKIKKRFCNTFKKKIIKEIINEEEEEDYFENLNCIKIKLPFKEKFFTDNSDELTEDDFF